MKFYNCASSRRVNEENKSGDQSQAQKAGLIQHKTLATASESRNTGASQGPKLHTSSKVISSIV